MKHQPTERRRTEPSLADPPETGRPGRVIQFPGARPQAAEVKPSPMPELKPGYYSAARLAELERAFRLFAVNTAVGYMEVMMAPEDPDPGRHLSTTGEPRELEAGA